MGPLLNGAGDLVKKDTEKSEVLSIFSVFTGGVCSHYLRLVAEFGTERYYPQWKMIMLGRHR